MSEPMEPTTAEEWQTAVDAANAMLVLKRAVDRGFITFDGSMAVQIARCEAILARGRALGYQPNEAAIETLVRGFSTDPEGPDADLAVEVVLSVAHEARA